jgi:hypothetical protein
LQAFPARMEDARRFSVPAGGDDGPNGFSKAKRIGLWFPRTWAIRRGASGFQPFGWRPALSLMVDGLHDQLSLLKTKRAAIGDDPRTAVLDQSIERLALSEMAARREALYTELEAASIRVRNLQAAIHAHRICLRDHAERCTRVDDVAVMLAQCDRWSASSLPPTTATPGDIQTARRQWLAEFAELK